MHFNFGLAAALVAAPSLVSASQGFLGFSLGVQKADGSCKTQQDFEDDFDAMKSASNIVRTYDAAQCDHAMNIAAAAVKKQFKVIFAVVPQPDEAFNKGRDAIQKVLADKEKAGVVYGITVGSEDLYRGDMSADKLSGKIQDMKKAIPGAKVGFADTWNFIANGTADPILKAGVDMVLVNAFSYWQGQSAENSVHSYLDDLFQSYTKIQTVAGNTDIEIWTGETGWPTDGGNDNQAAKAGTQYAATFFKNGVCAALNWGFNVFYFEAFDEPNKADAKSDAGVVASEAHWGAFTVDRKAKFDLTC